MEPLFPSSSLPNLWCFSLRHSSISNFKLSNSISNSIHSVSLEIICILHEVQVMIGFIRERREISRSKMRQYIFHFKKYGQSKCVRQILHVNLTLEFQSKLMKRKGFENIAWKRRNKVKKQYSPEMINYNIQILVKWKDT